MGPGRVEMWRGGRRFGLSVSASFVWRCPSNLAIAPFPHPARRTEHTISRTRLSDKNSCFRPQQVVGARHHRSHVRRSGGTGRGLRIPRCLQPRTCLRLGTGHSPQLLNLCGVFRFPNLRLLVASSGAKVAGRDLHPRKDNALARRTEWLASPRCCPTHLATNTESLYHHLGRERHQ